MMDPSQEISLQELGTFSSHLKCSTHTDLVVAKSAALSANRLEGKNRFSMDETTKNEVSSAKAVLLGALASGVNGPTWSAIKITFLTLGVCFAGMLALSVSSNDVVMIIHITLLVLISGTLFLLLNNKLGLR